MRKIPYGEINFETIIKSNYLYIDKTQYIEKDTLLSLLFYYGYSTIKENMLGLDVSFKIPNYAVSEIYMYKNKARKGNI